MWRDLNAGLWCWTHVFIPPSSTSTFKCTTGIHPVNLCGAIRVLMTAGLKIKIRSLYSRIIMTKWSQTTSSEWKMVQEAKKALTLSCCSTAGKKSPSTAKQCESVNSEKLWCLGIMLINLGLIGGSLWDAWENKLREKILNFKKEICEKWLSRFTVNKESIQKC